MDWRKTLLPCKHILSVISGNVADISWKSLSSRYTLSPFFILDHEVVVSKEVTLEDNEMKNDFTEINVVEAESVLLDSIPKKCVLNRSKASSCREILNQIKSLSFIVYDNDALDHLHETLT